MIIGGDIDFGKDGEDTNVLTESPLGGDVCVAGALDTSNASGGAQFKTDRSIYQNNDFGSYDAFDEQAYLDIFDELTIKSDYWATFDPNGVIAPAVAFPVHKNLIFSSGDDSCLQVFHADRFDLWGNDGGVKAPTRLSKSQELTVSTKLSSSTFTPVSSTWSCGISFRVICFPASRIYNNNQPRTPSFKIPATTSLTRKFTVILSSYKRTNTPSSNYLSLILISTFILRFVFRRTVGFYYP
jgi:hypothetical protein